MSRGSLNLGIVAHVDAGKTTLTERLLFATGVIDRIGSVDAGTTQTDSLALERQRGITIRSAVVSFPIDDVSVNLIDTPGHPDFIAEVERVLSVLDGAVLVISAVEGVQPQTRVLMRALRRLRVPTLLFINKIDRPGADPDRVLAGIADRLTAQIVPMVSVTAAGTRAAAVRPHRTGDPSFRTRLIETLAGNSDALLAAYVADEAAMTGGRLRAELAAQASRAVVHPVFAGSAITGAGLPPLLAGLVELLPTAGGDPDGPLSGQVFTIRRGAAGEKQVYVRLFSGTLRIRDRVRFGRDGEGRVTAAGAVQHGAGLRRGAVYAGEIGRLRGLDGIRVGDPIGEPTGTGQRYRFAPPTLETVVTARRAADRGALHAALGQLAEQDPLINVRQDDARQEISVSLYGEVQKEVIAATLADEYGVEATFRESTTICVERPVRAGEAVETMYADGNPFLATIGLRIEPAADGSGIDFRSTVDIRAVPLYIYKSADNFAAQMGHHVRRALVEGLFGWQVTDCTVTMFASNYSSPDGPPATRGPLSAPGDFRNLTPIVVMRALAAAGTQVCEPVVRASLEVPADTLGTVLATLARLGAAVTNQYPHGTLASVDAVLPATDGQRLHRRLPALTSGEGVLETSFGGYRPVRGAPPTRRRTTADPLNRDQYLMYLSRQGTKG